MTGSAKVLIADDHPHTVQVCRAALEAHGFSVVAAVTLQEASDTVVDVQPAIIVMDADLADGDTLRFCARLRETADRRRTPILLLVPPRFPADRLAGLRPLCDGCLFKPFHVNEFIERIQQMTAPTRGYDTASGTGGRDVLREAPPAMDIKAGSVIANCRIERVLGHGASGAVYLGRHLELDLQVALKLVPSFLAGGDEEELQRFVRGARAAARIQHPNVVPVLNAGKEGAFHFLVQRYVEGDTLKARIAAEGRLGENAVVQIMRDIGSGLGAVHRSGIVHRDVKPSNIVMTPPGVAMLTDFGLARSAGQGDISGQSDIVGTPYYMSPEQCDARPLDARSDLYSLGATAYHALTGRVPIQGDTPVAVLRGHIEHMPPSPRELIPEIPEGLSAVVMKLLAKSADQRYQSAEEMLAALERVTPCA